MQVATITIEFDGDLFCSRLVVPAEANVLGLRAMRRNVYSDSSGHAQLDDDTFDQLCANISYLADLLKRALYRDVVGDGDAMTIVPLF